MAVKCMAVLYVLPGGCQVPALLLGGVFPGKKNRTGIIPFRHLFPEKQCRAHFALCKGAKACRYSDLPLDSVPKDASQAPLKAD